MENISEVKSRKSAGPKKPKGTKPLETLKPTLGQHLFCALGNLFGIQPSCTQNADVGPPDIRFTPQRNGIGKKGSYDKQFTTIKVIEGDFFMFVDYLVVIVSICYLTEIKKPLGYTKSELERNKADMKTQWGQPLVDSTNSSNKSLLWAYVLWLFGGIFGLHLFYLERDTHAFLTWSTLGGYGFGWIADVLKIPRYVRECNNDPRYLQDLVEKIRRNRKPPFSTTRFVSAVMIGYLWGQLVLLAIPQDEVWGINWNTYLHWLIPLAVALGVWTVGNIGKEQGKPWITIAVSYVTYLSRWYFYDENIWLSLLMFVAALSFDSFSKEWRRTPRKKRSLWKRTAALTCCAVIYLGLWSSYVYFNGKITDSNGDEIPVHQALHHFFTSSWWTDFKQSLYDIYQYAQHHGWYEIWKQVIDLSDPQGEHNAYKVLGVSPTASQQEITSRWRALSREHHPDKVKDPEKQRDAQERFMEIQQAYEILSNIKNKRSRKNKKSVGDEF